MERKRLDTVWQTAYRLFLSNSNNLQKVTSSSSEAEAIATKEQSEALAKRCYWHALHGLETLDNEHFKMTKRVKK